MGTIIFLAAIAGVDPQLYEAAKMDGAGRFRQAWHVTLPAIRARDYRAVHPTARPYDGCGLRAGIPYDERRGLQCGGCLRNVRIPSGHPAGPVQLQYGRRPVQVGCGTDPGYCGQ
ncbi:ABC transporter permease subunit [Paenibacillus sp. P26]|nr:ABC transporter permease subunit [Paenibacillus sp. P26]